MLTEQKITIEEHLTKVLGVDCTGACSNPAQAAMVREKLVLQGCRVELIGDLHGGKPDWYGEVRVKKGSGGYNYGWQPLTQVWQQTIESEASSVAAALATGWKEE